MDTKKWEALLTAVELGSFTKAAERLGYTQSGLTHMMHALEKEVGLSLLVRDRYGVRLTPAGERLLPAIREFQQAGKRLENQVLQVGSMKKESIRVAAYSSICVHWLPSIVSAFRRDHPDISVDIRMGTVDEMYTWLQEDKVDLSFVSHQPREGFDWVPLWDDPLLAILPPDYPIGSQAAFPVREFSGREFLMPSQGFDYDILPIFRAAGVSPDVRDTSVDDATVISMVELGLGFSILSELILQGRQDNIIARPLDVGAHRSLGITLLSLEQATPITLELIEYSKAVVKRIHGGKSRQKQEKAEKREKRE